MAKSKIPNPGLRMLKNNILFQFEDEFTTYSDKKLQQRGFREVTASGIIVVSPKKSSESARWGVVIKVGPEVTDEIKVGNRIFIEKLMWTNGEKFDGQEYWVTNEDKVLCVQDTE